MTIPDEPQNNTTRKKRDHKAEKLSSLERRAKEMAQIRQDRESGELDEQLMQVAQALILCGLPYNPTDEKQIVRRARLADGSMVSVAFSAGLPGIPLPYGSDRMLLHWMVDKVIKTKNPVVSWETATEFLSDMGMAESGKNRKDLKARYKRLSGLTLGVIRKGASEATMLVPFIEESHLPNSVDERADKNGQQLLRMGEPVFGFRLGDKIFKEILKHHVPVPFALLKATRKGAQLQDMMLFLHWRSYAAQTESLIPWQNLREQLWQEDNTARRIRTRFKSAIEALKVVWPELQAEARQEGLWIAPPKGNNQLLPQGGVRRRELSPNLEV
jgi:Plasmid encoded RepA protein